jgi:protein-L-isoaspartate O-methyltransferase
LVHDDEIAARVRAIDRIEQLVAQGRSRLTAHRIVEIERQEAEAGRARRHPTSR